MASKLVNLKRTLAWKDFGAPKPGADPAPGVIATAAQVRATHAHTMNGEVVPGSKPQQFRLKDSVTVTVTLLSNEMFVNAWVLRQPKDFQDKILHHEQGHYDLVALFCRDLFIDLMAIKDQTFSNGSALKNAVDAVFKVYDPMIKAVHKPYDDDTKHGRDDAKQKKWDGIIQKAFTTPRSPAVTAPDGTAYKMPLADCLKSAGVKI